MQDPDWRKQAQPAARTPPSQCSPGHPWPRAESPLQAVLPAMAANERGRRVRGPAVAPLPPRPLLKRSAPQTSRRALSLEKAGARSILWGSLGGDHMDTCPLGQKHSCFCSMSFRSLVQEFPLLPLLHAPKHQLATPACRKMGEELSGPCVLGAQITLQAVWSGPGSQVEQAKNYRLSFCFRDSPMTLTSHWLRGLRSRRLITDAGPTASPPDPFPFTAFSTAPA